ncbi:MAG: UDP-N-acetylmuramate--L-alanine ligase [Pedobacter sp.]|jgi:UDP-N-acetylmuramate--alanine ligase|nr:UDP-N-acetylmuramate--L-alanine ligase [Pedobacter sp.]
MKLEAIDRVYFVGIGGIGMSALARYFAKRGCLVAGYDKTRTNLCAALEQEGLAIQYTDDLDLLPEAFQKNSAETLIVYTPAIPSTSTLLNYFKDSDFSLKKRSEVLGLISAGQFCIAVAGTHGKTTTSSMIAHILKETGYDCTAFLGGIATNYDSNFLLGDNDTVVVEADEYDRSFLTIHPDIAVITSMDADHLDIYGDSSQLEESFKLFAGQLKPEGSLIIKSGLPIISELSYGLNSRAEINGLDVRIEDGYFVFNFAAGEMEIENIRMLLPGKHNIENAVAAIAVALKLGIDPLAVKEAIGNFRGVRRRFEYVLRSESHVYIDDYAHHPEELRACFNAVRELYPDKKLTVIFQPHLFSRTRDFADEFAKVLSTADDLLLLEIYPAREMPIEGINAQMLLDKIDLEHKALCNKEDVILRVQEKNPELLLTVGAGDIDTFILPLKELLSHA